MIGVYRPVALRSGERPGIPDIGSTRTHGSAASVEVLSTLDSGFAGDETAQLMLARCTSDLPRLCALFAVSPAPVRVVLTPMPSAMPTARVDNTIFCDVDGAAATKPGAALWSCHLLAIQIALFAAERSAADWSPHYAHSRAFASALAGSLYPRWRAAWSMADDWRDGARPDAVNVAGDAEDPVAFGCAELFLDHLHHELELPWRTIAQAGGPSLAVVYRRASAAFDDPFPAFMQKMVAVSVDRGTAPAAPAAAGAGPEPVLSAADAMPGDRSIPENTEQHRAEVPLLADLLAHRRWWVIDTPVRHLRAENVFTNTVYDSIVATFRERMTRGDLTRSIAGYDASAAAVTTANAGGFAVFLTQAWHDTIASLLGVAATGDIIATLHHHAAGSTTGTVHNDLNPGWFPQRDAHDTSVQVHDPVACNYRTGESRTGIATVQRTRAISLLYYFDTPAEVVGGGTGFYRSVRQQVDRPEFIVPPRNNSLVAFECTPYSFHTFLANFGHERNCLVMWLHRAHEDAVARWGSESIVGWR